MRDTVSMIFSEIQDMRRDIKDDFKSLSCMISKKISWTQFCWIVGGITACGILVASFLWGAIKETNEKIATSEEKVMEEIFKINPR